MPLEEKDNVMPFTSARPRNRFDVLFDSFKMGICFWLIWVVLSMIILTLLVDKKIISEVIAFSIFGLGYLGILISLSFFDDKIRSNLEKVDPEKYKEYINSSDASGI